jgi:hypothetical protein
MTTAQQRRRWTAGLYLSCVLVLCAAAIGLRPGLRALERGWTKLPAACRRPLRMFATERLPSFRAAPGVAPLETAEQREVGADDLFMVGLEARQPGPHAVRLALFVTYYSNPTDRVPHTPEVCYRQTGTTIRSLTTVNVAVPRASGEADTVSVRVVDMERGDKRQMVAYVFYACGRYCTDRLKVRWILAWPGDRYAYFSKIEAAASYADDAAYGDAQAQCTQLLREALPVLIAEHYPPTETLKGP